MVEAQTESVKRWMFNSTNTVLGRMEQFRRTGENSNLSLNNIRLALAKNGADQSIESKLTEHYIKKYSQIGLDNKGLKLHLRGKL